MSVFLPYTEHTTEGFLRARSLEPVMVLAQATVRVFTPVQFLFLRVGYPVQGREVMLVFLFWGTANTKRTTFPASLSFV